MNNSFNHFIKYTFLASLGILAVSGLLIFSYMDSKGLSFDTLFDEANFYFDLSDYKNQDFDLKESVTTSISHYDLVYIDEDARFDLVDNISVSTSIEDIQFVHEQREDIRVTFEREVPDTSAYVVNYKARTSNNELFIDVDLKNPGFYADQTYKGLITIYLPTAYHCSHLNIDSAVASHDLVLPNSVDYVMVDVNFGSLDLTSNSPLQDLSLSVNAGDLYFRTNDPIQSVRANVDTGELSFDVMNQVTSLDATNNIGSISAYFAHSPNEVEITSNLGDIHLEFDEPIHYLTTSLDVGDIDIKVSKDEQGTVYSDTDLVEFNSHLDKTNKKSSANIIVEMNLGETNIH